MSTKRLVKECELEEILYCSDESDNDSASETDDHISEAEVYDESDDTCDEEVGASDERPSSTVDLTNVTSKNGSITWMCSPRSQQGRRPASSILSMRPGPTRYAVSRINNEVKSSFNLFFPPKIIKIILKMTNLEGQRIYGNGFQKLTEVELEAYFGLLLLAGVYRSRGEATSSLWDANVGRSIFRATMSLQKFHIISRIIRFDDKDTRASRRGLDKLAPIRELWDEWVAILPMLYNPTANVTIDEQLVPFRGRCPFRQYIPSKPAKYGIKIWTLCDSENAYAYNMQVYTGKLQGGAPERNQGCRVVLDLTHGLKGYNVTCDNFFTSYNLGQMLLKRNLTMLGTIRRNKPELPLELTCNRKEIHSSKFFFTNDTTIVSYMAKRYKNVTLMSTLHHNSRVSDSVDKKPQIILDYNKTKGAVDTLDKLVMTYTCRRQTKRWPMNLFYNMLDVSAYNAYVLWCAIHPSWNERKLTKRRIFLEELGKSLVKPLLEQRTHLPRDKSAAEIVKSAQASTSTGIVSKRASQETPQHLPKKRARCNFCPSSNDNKTYIVCHRCSKYLCKLHVFYYCPHCHNI